jgi:hypothetical protein
VKLRGKKGEQEGEKKGNKKGKKMKKVDFEHLRISC